MLVLGWPAEGEQGWTSFWGSLSPAPSPAWRLSERVRDGSDVIDQSVVDLANNPIEQLTETVVGTNRLLANENHRLVATRLCWTDHPSADQLRRALEDSGVHNVAVLSQSQAVTALMRAAGRSGGVLVVDENTATLSVVGSAEGDPDAPPTMLASEPLRRRRHRHIGHDDGPARRPPGRPERCLPGGRLVGSDRALPTSFATSTMRVQIPEDPTFALARGAAIAAAPPTGDSTAMAPAVGLTGDATAMAPAAGLTGDETAIVPRPDSPIPTRRTSSWPTRWPTTTPTCLQGEFDEFDDDYVDDPDAETGPLKLSRRSLLIGNAVVAFAVIGLASLAVAVASPSGRPRARSRWWDTRTPRPGKFMPLLPTQQQAPVPPPPPEAAQRRVPGRHHSGPNGYIPPQ